MHTRDDVFIDAERRFQQLEKGRWMVTYVYILLKCCQETKKLADESSKFNDSVNGMEVDQVFGKQWD